MKFWWVCIALIVVGCSLVAYIGFMIKGNGQRAISTPSQDRVHRREILGKLSSNQVSTLYIPVHIFREDIFWGSGTLCTVDGRPVIITAAHLFLQGFRPAHYSYQRLQPFEEMKHPIASIEPLPAAKRNDDLMICVPGESRMIEHPYWDDKLGRLGIDYQSAEAYPLTNLTPEMERQMRFRHLVSGEEFRVVAYSKRKDFGERSWTYVIPYYGIPGESGSGLVNSDGQLLVIVSARDGVTEPQRLALNLSSDTKGICICYLLNPVTRKEP